MNYDDAIKGIGGRLRFGIKPGLERIRGLLCRLGEPQNAFKAIHIAGTNGKGSTAKMIAQALICAGKKTGLYISPFLEKPTECIQIDGKDISEGEFAALYAQVTAFSDGSETEFELLTAMAFQAFANNGCEYAVVECGMGGAEDATNVIDEPLCCVLTGISLDHVAVLGSSIAEIAENKCGIIKSGCTVVSCPGQSWEALEIIGKHCSEKRVKLICCTCDPSDVKCIKGNCFTIYDDAFLSPLMRGKYQIYNAITAYEALKTVGVERQFIEEGIATAKLYARCEILCETPLTILDGCHNPGAAAELNIALDELLQGKKAVAVMGMLETKDYRETIRILSGHFCKVICCDGFRSNCVPARLLAETSEKYAPSAVCDDPESAVLDGIEAAMQNNTPLVILGSLYLAGRIREFVKDKLSSR